MKPGMTRIICTIGPSSSSPDTFRRMADEGMGAARLNFSHGTHKSHSEIIEMIRRHNDKSKKRIAVLQDLEGYRIRVGSVSGGEEGEMEAGARVFWGREEKKGRGYVQFDYDGPLQDIKPGSDLYADDGMLHFRVVSSSEDMLETEVIIPGLLKKNKGVNLPDVKLSFTGVKEKDSADILFGIENEVDFIAQSFVRSAEDMSAVKRVSEGRRNDIKFIAKIECREGIENIDGIIAESDGIMIARGDMGVSIPVYRIPVIQKQIIRKCNEAGKFVITATQMLESMTNFPRPTRAEVSDVSNAVLDGSDYVMLSGETAVGKYPVETVALMRKTIEYTSENSDLPSSREGRRAIR